MLVDVCIQHSYRALLRSVVGEHVVSGPYRYAVVRICSCARNFLVSRSRLGREKIHAHLQLRKRRAQQKSKQRQARETDRVNRDGCKTDKVNRD